VASITIRNLDQATKELLRVRAATHGRSMEEEARDILRVALSVEESRVDLFTAIRRRFAPLSGVDLDVPEREPMREPPELDP